MKRRKLLQILGLALLVSVPSASGRGETWPQFRGPSSDGVASSPIPNRWSTDLNVRWKVAVPGEGWSCPIVWKDRVFLTTAVIADAASEDLAGPEPYRGGGGRQRGDLLESVFHWDLLCLDAASGELLWRRTAHSGRPPLPRHSSNTYATETPIVDGERVYAYFGMVGLFCFDLSGELQWSRKLDAYEMRAGWGAASSPALHDGRLFLQVDNEQQSFALALDSRTGRELWRIERDEPSQYSTPIVWRNSLRNELILGGQVCRSYDPATGELLWSLEMRKGRSSATPLAVADRLFVGTELRNRGGSDDGGGYLFAVRPGGSGDLSLKADESHNEFVLWAAEKSGLQMASPVHCQGRLYLLDRRSGIVHCLDAATGETVYRERIPGARAFWASPWTSGELVYCLDDAGATHVLTAGDALHVAGVHRLGETAWSSPAMADGALYLRTVNDLYCIAAPEN